MRDQFLRTAILLLFWPMTMLPACSAMDTGHAPTKSSTRGTTLVRMAVVTAVQDLAPTNASTGTPQSHQSKDSAPQQEVAVRFEDGQTSRYRVAADQNLQPGDQVQVSTSPGTVRITR
jgi:hypothetical protein